jgi:hypothetical protein
MNKILHKLLLLVTLSSIFTSAHSLSEENAQLGAIAGGVIAGVGTACAAHLKGNNGVTVCATVIAGGLTWWALDRYLYSLTPESKYRSVENIICLIKANSIVEENFNSVEAFTQYVTKKFANFSTAKAHLKNISAQLTEAQLLIKAILGNKLEQNSKLFKKCKKLEAEINNILLSLRTKIHHVDYLIVKESIDKAATDLMVTQNFESQNALMHFITMRFGASWPLILAKNHCASLFETITQIHSYLQSIIIKTLKDSSDSKKRELLILTKQAQSILIILKQKIKQIIENDDYSFQVALYEKHMTEKRQREQLEHQMKLQHEQHEFQQKLRNEQREYLEKIQRELSQNQQYLTILNR